MALITEVLSQGQFRDLKPDPKWAVVALLNHDEIYPPPTDGYVASLEMIFDDVIDEALPLWTRWKLDRMNSQEAVSTYQKKMDERADQTPWPVTTWHAEELYRFTMKLKRKHPNLLGVRVYCEYGKSRSPLAAEAMERWWKGKAFTADAINPDGRANGRWARLLSKVAIEG